MQNIPVKGDYGLRIREAFIGAARPPQLLCADEGQGSSRVFWPIFPRIPSSLCVREGRRYSDGDGYGNFQSSRRRGHQQTGARRRAALDCLWHQPIRPRVEHRGASAGHRARIETFFEKFAAVRALMDRNINDGKTKGYTTTIMGRRRPIPELQSGDPSQRGCRSYYGEQSDPRLGGRTLIKVAMINVHRSPARRIRPAVKMILQVHDELIFEVPDEEGTGEASCESRNGRTGAALGSVGAPLKVDVGVGCNWRAAHP